MEKEQRELDKLQLDKLRKLFNAPKAPEDLSVRLKANLEGLVQEQSSPPLLQEPSQEPSQELSQKPSQKPSHIPRRRRSLAFGLAAGLALALVIVLFEFRAGSGFIALAYAHIQDEAGLEGTLDGGYENWFKTAGLQIPAEANDIVLSKNCALGELKTKHLRFDLPNQGTVNLFVYKDSSDAPSQIATGKIAGQRWMIASPRGDFRLLAIYDDSVKKQQVAHIIQSMFEQDSA